MCFCNPTFPFILLMPSETAKGHDQHSDEISCNAFKAISFRKKKNLKMSENECSGPILPLFPPSGADPELLADTWGLVFTLSGAVHDRFAVYNCHCVLLTPLLCHLQDNWGLLDLTLSSVATSGNFFQTRLSLCSFWFGFFYLECVATVCVSCVVITSLQSAFVWQFQLVLTSIF